MALGPRQMGSACPTPTIWRPCRFSGQDWAVSKLRLFVNRCSVSAYFGGPIEKPIGAVGKLTRRRSLTRSVLVYGRFSTKKNSLVKLKFSTHYNVYRWAILYIQRSRDSWTFLAHFCFILGHKQYYCGAKFFSSSINDVPVRNSCCFDSRFFVIVHLAHGGFRKQC
jgi:hypothetical protein